MSLRSFVRPPYDTDSWPVKHLVQCRMPSARAVLLYGAAGTGKTLLARGVAGSAGALLLDLSPRATDGERTFPNCPISREPTPYHVWVFDKLHVVLHNIMPVHCLTCIRFMHIRTKQSAACNLGASVDVCAQANTLARMGFR